MTDTDLTVLRTAAAMIWDVPEDQIGRLVLITELPATTPIATDLCCWNHTQELLRSVADGIETQLKPRRDT